MWLSKSANPKRKLAHSWELIEVDLGAGAELVGINTAHPNALAGEAIAAGAIAELAGYDLAPPRGEVRQELARRFPARRAGRPPCYVEIKNVHLMRRPGLAEFPDAVTKRGAKHLDELGEWRRPAPRGDAVPDPDRLGARFALARDIDPAYGRAFDAARAAGSRPWPIAAASPRRHRGGGAGRRSRNETDRVRGMGQVQPAAARPERLRPAHPCLHCDAAAAMRSRGEAAPAARP